MEEMIWRTHIPIFSHYLLDTTLFFHKSCMSFLPGHHFIFFPLKASKTFDWTPNESSRVAWRFVYLVRVSNRLRPIWGWCNKIYVSLIQWGVCFHIIFLSFPVHTVSLVVSPAWKATYDFRASSPRPIRTISTNVLVVVPVCSHSYDDWFFISSFLYVFPCSSGQHFFFLASRTISIWVDFLSSSQPLWVGRLVGCVNVCCLSGVQEI